jgi:phage portal protein BeeE
MLESLLSQECVYPWIFNSWQVWQPREAAQFIIDNELTRKTSDVIGWLHFKLFNIKVGHVGKSPVTRMYVFYYFFSFIVT